MEEPISMVPLQGKSWQDEKIALDTPAPIPVVDAPADEDFDDHDYDEYDDDEDYGEVNPIKYLHPYTLRFSDPGYESLYEEFYWDQLRRKFKMYSGLMIVLFSIYVAVLIPLTEDNTYKDEVLVSQLVLVFFPLMVMLVFGNNRYLPHSLALVLNCAVFVLSTAGAILSVGLLYYSHLHHPIIYAGLFFTIGSVMPNFYIPFIFTVAVDFVILILYLIALGLSKDGFSHELAPFSFIMFLVAIMLSVWTSRDHEIQMRVKFIYFYRIEMEKRKLKEEVWTLEHPNGEVVIVGNVNIDMESPMEKAITVLKDLIRRSSDEDARNLNQVLEVILKHQDNLTPSIEKQIEEGGKEIDNDIKNWLFYELVPINNKKETPHSDYRTIVKPDDAGDEDALMEKVRRKPWDWDMFMLNKVTQGRPLFFVAMYLFKEHDFIRKYNINEAKLQNFIGDVEDGYGKEIPYHNNMHAADVLLSVHYILTTGKLSKHVSDIELFAGLLAACVHDYNHPGFNNAFHINTNSTKALIYNDRSVLENYHIAASWMLLMKPENNILEGLNDAERKTVRKTLVDMILTTDMAMHFESVGDLKSKLMANKNELNLEDARTKELLLKLALKVSDIGHTAKGLELHEKWTARVQNEFYNQGDEERRLGIPVSPFMDRKASSIPKSQIGFINFVVLPLFDSFNYCKDYDVLVNQLRLNHAHWENKLKEETEAAATTIANTT